MKEIAWHWGPWFPSAMEVSTSVFFLLHEYHGKITSHPKVSIVTPKKRQLICHYVRRILFFYKYREVAFFFTEGSPRIYIYIVLAWYSYWIGRTAVGLAVIFGGCVQHQWDLFTKKKGFWPWIVSRGAKKTAWFLKIGDSLSTWSASVFWIFHWKMAYVAFGLLYIPSSPLVLPFKTLEWIMSLSCLF